MKRYNISATYSYEAEGIIAKDEDEAYTLFLADLNSYYTGMEDYEIEAEADLCENCEEELDECECEDEDDE